jgi:hypothetical protein
MRSERSSIWSLSLMLMLLLARPLASARADEPARPQSAPGSATRGWLELQRSGRSAGPLRPMPSEAALLIYRQYVDSFKPSLQEFLTDDLPSLGAR